MQEALREKLCDRAVLPSSPQTPPLPGAISGYKGQDEEMLEGKGALTLS